MARLKSSMLFNYVSNIPQDSPITRTAGWSEGFYNSSVNFNDRRAEFEVICNLRALLLPQGAAIIGQRYQQVDPVGASQTFNRIFPGSASRAADIPQMSLFCKLVGKNVRNTRGMKIKALPDDQVLNGEYVPSSSYKAAVTTYLKALVDMGWFFRGRDLDQTPYPVMTIVPTGANGTVSMEGTPPFIPGDFVRILKTRISGGRAVGGRFRVSLGAVDNTFVIQNWNFGTTTGGQVRKDAIIFPTIGGAVPVRVSTGKVGRPFFGYVGRRSKRK